MQRRQLLAAALVLTLVNQANAENQSPEGKAEGKAAENPAMDHIIVTATRVDRDISEVMRSISLLDRQHIDSIQGQSVGDLVNALPNITLAGGARAGSQTINIRGLGGNKLLQTVDGARLSFESGHRPSYYLDPALVKSVEALRGPASSLWGSGALGGVIAQRTLDASDLAAAGSMGGFVRTGYNENNHQQTTTVALAGMTANTDWLLSGYHRDSDDLVLGNGETLQHSASDDFGYLTKFTWEATEDHQLQFNYRASTTDGSVPSNGTAQANNTSNFVIQRETDTQHANARWRFTPGNDLINSQALVYWNRIEVDEARVSDGRGDNTELNETGINLMNVSTFGVVTLQYGADLYREEFEALRSGTNRPLPPKAVNDVWSVYVQGEAQLNEAWRVDLGLRHDDFTTEADNLNDRRSDSSASSSMALVYQPADTVSLAIRYDEAFRAPTAEELYTSGTHFCMGPGFCNRFVPNDSLEAESASNVELIGKFSLNNLLGADVISIEAAAFDNNVDNFIEQIVTGPSFFHFPDPGTTTWVNVSDADISGFEVQAAYLRGGMNLSFAYGQTRGTDNATGDDLTNIPADTLSADLSYTFSRQALKAGLRWIHADSQRRTNYAENTAGLSFDGYSVVDLYASWSPSALPAIQFDLNVNNIEDTFYRRAWDQLPEAGREVILSARYSF